MNIYFSRHAKRQMKWRKISAEEAEETITNPELIKDSIQGRKNAFKRIHNRWIKVTYKEEEDVIIVITAIEKNKR